MAKMHPEDIHGYERSTKGEKKVFRFLKEAARPDEDYICWYKPPIGKKGKEPDFILFVKKLGLVVMEVEDWTLKGIISHNPSKFTIRVSDKKEKKANPDRQAKIHVNALKQILGEMPEFVSGVGPHSGKVKIPIGRMVVFPNIGRRAYAETGLRWIIDPERVLFKKDLDPAGEILPDTSGKAFYEKISACLPFSFKGLTRQELDKLSFLIWPETQIKLPLRKGSGKSRFKTEVQALDEAQARLARRVKSGHLIIKGPPGSGKTLLLVHRCYHLQRYHSKVKKILLVCYNIALAKYLRGLIREKGLRPGDNGVHIYHFYELCSHVLGEPVRYENEDKEYYELIVRLTLEKVAQGKSRLGFFDAIFVDEGQDFSNEMLKTVLPLLRKGGDLVIALDSYQDLYSRRGSWKSLGIHANGRTRYLRNVYRNTAEIFRFTQRFIGETPKNKRQLALLPHNFAFHGERPELCQFPDFDEVADFLVGDMRERLDQDEYKRSEIAIIYDDKLYGPDGFAYDNRAVPMRILKKLERSGVFTTWVSQDAQAKEMYDITTDRVSLISIHSSKGLDFDLVYLVGIEHIRPTDQTRKKLISLVYVAMTRAKYRLVIPYTKETELIKRMKECLIQ